MTLPLIIGTEFIDGSLKELIKAMSEHPPTLAMTHIMSIAKSLGLLLALCVGSYECWQMMLGRHGLDVMKLLRIVGISLCITFSATIVSMLRAPGDALTTLSTEMCREQLVQVDALENEIIDAQKKYIDRLNAMQDSIYAAKERARLGEDPSIIAEALDAISISNVIEKSVQWFDRMYAIAVMYIVEGVNMVIRLCAQLYFQVLYFAMLLGANIFMCIMAVFAPINFALSLAPPYKAAWSQWLSKFVSLSLWGFITNLILYYITYIMLYSMQLDLKVYTVVNPDASAVSTFGIQGFGTTIMYVLSAFVGGYLLRYVPEVSSWLIPGGVSSGLGQSVGATHGITGGAIAGTITKIVK